MHIMNEENKLITDFDFSLIADFFKKLDRQGPGGDQETLKALSFMQGLPSSPKIADIGCGTGHQTAVLASSLTCCTIQAVDLLPEMVAGLTERMEREHLGGKVTGITASMDALPFRTDEFDVFWAEGSIYLIGFEKGLREWRKYIKPGGYIAVSECSWLTEARPQDMGYMAANFPGIGSIAGNIQAMSRAGYRPAAHFILPEYCWLKNYYAPIVARIQEFLTENGHSRAALCFAARMKEEISYYEANKAYYGYVFYVGQKTD